MKKENNPNEEDYTDNDNSPNNSDTSDFKPKKSILLKVTIVVIVLAIAIIILKNK